MPDSSRNSQRRRLKLTATEAGIATAQRALIRLGFETKTNFAQSHYISRSTVTKFFCRTPIQLDTLKKICQELKLNWRKIAGIEDEQNRQSKTNSNSTSATDRKVKQMEQSSSRKVTVIKPSSSKKVLEITLEGDINSVSNLKIIETILQEHSGNIIQIQDIQKGRTQLTTENSPEKIEKTSILTKPGEPGELTQNSEEESLDLDKKWRLVQEIVSSPTCGRILNGVDLSDADLRGADLSDADLRGADLSDADLSDADLWHANLIGANLSYAEVKQAKFGQNEGISESMKCDLINRGAIFEYSPSSGDGKFQLGKYINIEHASKIYNIKKANS